MVPGRGSLMHALRDVHDCSRSDHRRIEAPAADRGTNAEDV
jgi:hypothetical protein